MKDRYYNHNSSMLHPKPVRDYISPDGMWCVLPCGKKWMIIYNSTQLELTTSFDIAMRKLDKMKKSQSKPQRRPRTPAKPKSTKKQDEHLLHPSGGKGSERVKTTVRQTTRNLPKSKGVTITKPSRSTGNPLLDALQ